MKMMAMLLMVLMMGCGVAPAGASKFQGPIELAGTDADCQMLDKIFGNKLQQVLPRNMGFFSQGHKVELYRVPYAMIQPIRNAGETTSPGSQLNRAIGLRLLSVRPEDMIQNGKGDKSLEVVRPFFAVLTTGGSVIRGRDMYRLEPTEIKAVVRLLGNGGAKEITIFEITR
jgi:hypothetical protein